MKKNIKDIVILLFFTTLLFAILTNYSLVISNIKDITKVWLFKLFPSLFPFLVIGSILINYNLPYYISKFKIRNNTIIFILSLISGFPSSAKYTKEMYLNKYISLNEANNILCYSFFANPLFLLTIFSNVFSKKIMTFIVLSHYLTNVILALFLKEKNKSIISIYKTKENFNLVISKSIKDGLNTMLLILGTITFYNIIITLVNVLIRNETIICTIKGILEFSQGLNDLSVINISDDIKAYLALMFICFGSFSIHSQIKSILLDTPISYKKFFKYRIISVLISWLLLSLFIYLSKLFL